MSKFMPKFMNAPTLTTMLREIIAIPSVSSVLPELDQSNGQLCQVLASWLVDIGFTVNILQVAANPPKFNLIASIGAGEDGLVLAGHTDTVPATPSLWTSDPWQLTERDERYYGLGIADMKSFFAFVIEALKELDLRYLQRPLVIVGTANEEINMSGARALLTCGQHLGKYALIGEPTDFRPIRMHKGMTMEAIRITGSSGHSSDPALGNNALDGMCLVLEELRHWRTELQTHYHNPAFHVPVPTLNFGHIHGGDSPNRICGQCELHMDLRSLPGMSLDDLRMEMTQRLQRVLANSGLQLEIINLFAGIPAMETPASAAIVQAVETLTGHSAGSVAFGTEAPYFARMGLQTVILGPGSINQAHQPNEFLAQDRISPYVHLLRKLIQQFCLLS